MTTSRAPQFALASLAFAALLSACGGGGADTQTQVKITAVRVMGDSLADTGTFGGVRATIQPSAGYINAMYPERVSETYGLGSGCNFFAFNGTTFVPNPKANCKNYAIGGGVINPASGALSAQDPRGIGVQFATATAGGNFAATELLLVDGGGNDAAALVGAYLKAATDGGLSYTTLLSTVLTPAQMPTSGTAFPAAGVSYMTGLADKFYDMIKSGALDKGAQRVALLNMPGITNTPRFQLVLDSIAAANGGGASGAAARAQSEALFKSWTEAFNGQLTKRFAGDSRVAIVDFYTEFNNQVANPAQFALTNVKTPACPVVGLGTDGLPAYNFATCTDDSLSKNPPAGVSGGANWYKSYAFSDGFHPTPYGHQLTAQLISRTLAQAGWL